MRRGAGWRSAGSRLPRKQVICALAPYRTAGRGRRRGAAREVAADGPGPPRAGPAHLAVDNDRPLGSRAHASGGSWPWGAGRGTVQVQRPLVGDFIESRGDVKLRQNHHQDPKGDTTLTRPWPVVHARGGLRAKAGLSLHRVSAVMKRLSKIGGTSPAPEDH
jgi:hypothetical protein